MKQNNYEQNAVGLFRSSDTAVLSTITRDTDNYPFGSFITFVSGLNRELLIYASDIAEHTKNFINDSRACVTLFEVTDQGDRQNSARLSLIGDINPVDDADVQDCQNRFFTFLPESKQYSRIHGFNLYKLKIIKARWIGGFGRIAWLDTEHWTTAIPKWKNNEQAMIVHMNDDHSNVIGSALHAQFDIKDASARMIALSIDGYHAISDNRRYFIRFDRPCYTQKAIREALVEQAHRYRKFELS